MDVSSYRFSDAEVALLEQYRDNQSDARLKVRFIALLMLAKGIEIKDAASIIGKSSHVIENWHRQYVTKGLESLNSFQYQPKKCYLSDEQIAQTTTWVKTTNPQTLKEFLHLTGEENCNAKRVIEYFETIMITYLQAPKIILFLDNAKYHKAVIVNQWLKEHPKLRVEFIPPYAPNLNLIERFWRFAKEKLVKNTYCEKYKTFRAKVFQFLNHVDEYIDELSTLIVEKFQIIKTA